MSGVGRGRGATKPAWLIEQERAEAVADALAVAAGGGGVSAVTAHPPPFDPSNYTEQVADQQEGQQARSFSNNSNNSIYSSNDYYNVEGGSEKANAVDAVDREDRKDRDRDRRDDSREMRGSKFGRTNSNSSSSGGGASGEWRPDPHRKSSWDVEPEFPEAPQLSFSTTSSNSYHHHNSNSNNNNRFNIASGNQSSSTMSRHPPPAVNLSAFTSGAFNPSGAFTAPGHYNPTSHYNPSSLPSGLLLQQPQAQSPYGGPLRDTSSTTKIPRQLYVGNLPPNVENEDLALFFNKLLPEIFDPSVLPADHSVVVLIFKEKAFAFVEFPTIGIAQAILAADGLQFPFRGGMHSLRLRTTVQFKPDMLPPNLVVPKIDLSEQGIVSTTVSEGPRKIFIGGIPPTWNDQVMITILTSFGKLKAFNLVKDKDSSLSKGYGFCEYKDQDMTEFAVLAISQIPGHGGKNLTAKVSDSTSSAPKGNGNSSYIQQPALGMNMGMGVQQHMMQQPTRIIKLEHMITTAELVDDSEWRDIMEDTKSEFSKYGQVINVVIPRIKDGCRCEGMVFVEFANPQIAMTAAYNLQGRKFDGRAVLSTYVDEEQFYNRMLF